MLVTFKFIVFNDNIPINFMDIPINFSGNPVPGILQTIRLTTTINSLCFYTNSNSYL